MKRPLPYRQTKSFLESVNGRGGGWFFYTQYIRILVMFTVSFRRQTLWFEIHVCQVFDNAPFIVESQLFMYIFLKKLSWPNDIAVSLFFRFDSEMIIPGTTCSGISVVTGSHGENYLNILLPSNLFIAPSHRGCPSWIWADFLQVWCIKLAFRSCSLLSFLLFI